MKEKIHPKFYTDCKVTCGCGNTFITQQSLGSAVVVFRPFLAKV